METVIEKKVDTATTKKMNLKASKIIIYICLVLFAIICLYPLIWVAISSLKTNDELFANPWGLPKNIHWINYKNAWVDGNISMYFINSAIVCVISTVVAAVVSSMAAYGITRLRWKFSKLVLGFFLLGIMIPAHSATIPLFMTFTNLKIIGTQMALIIPYITFALPISIFILTGFLSTLPMELEEAAVMDGCSIIKAFSRIIVPIIRPAIATITIFNFVSMWNELLFAVIFVSDQTKMTLPVGLTNFSGQYATDWTGMMAAVIISVIPSVLIYIFLHDNIISGMTAGAVKG